MSDATSTGTQADDTPAGGGTRDANQQPEEKQNKDQTASGGQPSGGKAGGGTHQDKTFTQEEVNRLIKRETDKLEKRLKLNDDERKQAEIDDLRSQLRERDTRDAVTEAGRKLGAKNTRLLYQAVRDDLEFDDAGNVKNLKAVLDAAKTEYPELFATDGKKAKVDAGAQGKGSTSGTSMNDFIRGAFSR